MKRFFYSLIIVSMLLSSVGVMWPTDTYAAHCPKGQTHLLNLPKDSEGRSGCGVAPQGPTVTEVATGLANAAVGIWNCLGDGLIDCIVKAIAVSMLSITGWILYGAGILLNFAVLKTILEMSDFIKGVVAIDLAWSAFRDLTNIFFIFVLIYISVSTILGLSSRATKETMGKVIIVALLINFSLFFTKVIIDGSNIITLQFYNAIAPAGDSLDSGLSGAFQGNLNLNTIFNVKGGSSSEGLNAGAKKVIDDATSVLTVGFMGSLFFLIAAFVFITTAIFLINRFVILIFLMITSPLAYVGAILPKGASMSKKWWDNLIDQSIFAPVLMMFLWVTATIINSDYFRTLMSLHGDSTFVKAIESGEVSDVSIIFNFIVIITFLIVSLIAAKKAGAAGSGFATKLAAGATIGGAAWLGRHSLGRLGNTIANSGYAKNMAARGGAAGLYGRTLKSGAEKVAKSGFDLRKAGFGGTTLGGLAKDAGLSSLGDIGAGKGGYEAVLNKQIKKETQRAGSLGTKTVFKSAKTKGEYEGHQEKVKESKEKIEQIEKDLENVNADGVNLMETTRLGQERSAMETQIKTSEAEIKKIEENQGVIFNPKETYGTNLGNRRGVATPWKVPRKNREAASVILGKTKAKEGDKKENGNEKIVDMLHDLEDRMDDLEDDIKDSQ